MLSYKEGLDVRSIRVDAPTLTFCCKKITLSQISVLFSRIAEAGKIKILDLGENKITDATVPNIIKYLIRSPKLSLESLDLGGNEITEEGARKLLQALESNHTLTELHLNGNPGISKKTLNEIEERMARNKRRKDHKEEVRSNVRFFAEV